MARLSKTLSTSLALITIAVTACQVNAQSYSHIQGLARDIQVKSDLLLGDTGHYVYTPNYRQLVGCVADMRARAVRIHALSIHRGSLVEMSSQLARLDHQFHAIQNLFDTTEYQASRGRGKIKGPTRQVKQLLKDIEICIYQIRDDIRVLRQGAYRPAYSQTKYDTYRGSGYNTHPRSRVPSQRVHRSGRGSRVGVSRSGISYKNDKLSIRIGF